MDDENNDLDQQDLEQSSEQAAGVAQDAAGEVGDKVGDKVKGKAGEIKDRAVGNVKDSIMEKITGEPREKGKLIIGPDKKIRGTMYSTKGKAEEAAGTAVKAAGGATTAAGAAAEGAGAGVRAGAAAANLIGDALLAAGGAGAAVKAKAKEVDEVGKQIQEQGKNIKEKGKEIYSKGKDISDIGKHDIKRGETLKNKGIDIGASKDINLDKFKLPGGISGIPDVNPNKIKSLFKNSKKWLKSAFSKLPDWAKIGLIAIIIFIIIALIVVFIITSVVDGGKYDEGNLKNVPYVVTKFGLENIQLVADGEGGYTYAYVDEDQVTYGLDECAEKIIKTLNSNGSTYLSNMGKTSAEQKEFVKKLIKAEIATQYPDISICGESLIPQSGGNTYSYTMSASEFGQWGWLIQNENLNCYYYRKGLGNINYDSYAVKEGITEDKQNYIVTENSTGIYVGQGVQLYSNIDGGWNTENLALFANHGVNLGNAKPGDLVNPDIADSISQEIFKKSKQTIMDKAAAKGVKLSENQAVALVDIAYENGPESVNNYISKMAEVGEDIDKLGSMGGFQVISEDAQPTTRNQSRWKLFRYGKYESRKNNAYNPSDFGEITHASSSSEETQPQNLDVNSLTLEEKIYQMLMVTGEVTNPASYASNPVGGYVLSGKSTYDNLTVMGSSSKVAPFIATDDEGGKITRAAKDTPSAKSYGDSKDYAKLDSDEKSKTNTLLSKGINVNLSPVTDVTSSGTMTTSERSYSSDPAVVKDCVKTVIAARQSVNVNGKKLISTLKHYPGYPNNEVNTDHGFVRDDRSVTEINSVIDVFNSGISNGAETVMTSNVIYSNLDKYNPASLSSTIISELRKNFSGVIMTDDIDVASTQEYTDRYKRAVIAGNDILLVSQGNQEKAMNQIKQAVSSGEISEDRINESVNRILNLKKSHGIINGNNSAEPSTSGDYGTTSAELPVYTGEKELNGKIKVQRKDENGEITQLKFIDEKSFNQLMSENNEEVMNYYTLKKNSVAKQATISGGTGVLSDFIGSWENSALLEFKKGTGSYDNRWVRGYITEDGTQYICRTDEGLNNGTKNYGFGVMVNQWGKPNNVEYFSKYGIDITDPQYLQLKVSTLPVDIVDKVKADILADKVAYVENKAANHGVTLTTQQVHALVNVSYQFGDYGANLDNFMELYKTYGNTEELRSRYVSSGGTHVMISVQGGTNSEGVSRAESTWRLFHDGEYHPGGSMSIDPSTYSDSTSSSNTSGNTSTSNDGILFIGDSRYTSIKTDLEKMGNNATVCAVAGSKPSDWVEVSKSKNGTVANESVSLPENVSTISVMLGAYGASEQTEMKQVLQNLHENYPNAKIIFNSVYHVGDNYTNADKNTTNANIDSLNETIKTFSSSNNWVQYADITQGLTDENGFIANANDDGTIVTGDGITQLVNNIKSAVINGTLNTASSTSTTSTDNSNNASKYVIAVASSTTTNIRSVDSYQFNYSEVISTNSGSRGVGSQFSATPAGEVIDTTTVRYSSTNIDYQNAMKNYTSYFDFLWAAALSASDMGVATEWADEVLKNSNVEITIYSDVQTSTSSATYPIQQKIQYARDGSTVYADHYIGSNTTTTTNTTVTSKAGVTTADVWFIDYKNDADTYSEYQSKSKETVREKVEGTDAIARIFKKNNRLKTLRSESYLVDRMVKDNARVSHVYPIYQYVIDKLAGAKSKYKSLQEIIDLSELDLSSKETNNASTVTVLLYSSLNLSEEDKELLYKAVEQICGPVSDSDASKKAVASTILNRVLSAEFPNSVKGVVEQSGQYPNLDYSQFESVTPSESTINAVNAVISGGDVSQRSVYVATPSQAAALGWDNTLVMVFNDGDKSENSFNYYTTEDIKNELKRYETTIRAGTKMPSDAANKIVEWAEAQVGKTSFYNKSKSSDVVSKNQCASFVKSAYYEAGLGYMSGNAQDLPHPNPIEYNSDGTINYSNIPVGAIIVSKGSPVNGVYYGHVCLYVGNGYTIEAGGEKVAKLPIDQCYGNRGCAPLLGWGFAMEDQNDAYSKLVTSFGGGNYPQGWTPVEGCGVWYQGNPLNKTDGTGIQGYYNAGDKTYTVFCQGTGPWAITRIPENSKNIRGAGCGITSVSIVLTGLGYDITPNVFAGQHSAHDDYVKQHLKEYGANYKALSSLSQVVEELQKGNPVIYHVNNGRVGGKTYKGHYVALLGINESGEIFLADPGSTHNSGYFPQSQFTGMTSAFAVWK